MEKNIAVITRYRCQQDYFVEVSHEDSATASGRDYWLCRRNSPQKLYMFTSPYKNETLEKSMILANLPESINKYEHSTRPARAV